MPMKSWYKRNNHFKTRLRQLQELYPIAEQQLCLLLQYHWLQIQSIQQLFQQLRNKSRQHTFTKLCVEMTGTIVAPTVTSTDPISNATGVALNKTITANFSTVMDPLTINATNSH
jgi:hypothetical protein